MYVIQGKMPHTGLWEDLETNNDIEEVIHNYYTIRLRHKHEEFRLVLILP
jgi:hypothetical protein